MGKRAKKVLYDFDSSAKFYPLLCGKRTQSLFELGFELNCPVDGERLKRAVNDVVLSFPAMRVGIVRRFAWYKQTPIDAQVPVFGFSDRLQAPIDPKKTNGYWFRFEYSGKKIRLVMFHGLTDGGGAMEFAKSALARYAQLGGAEFDFKGIRQYGHVPCAEENEDAFLRYAEPCKLDIKEMAGQAPYRPTGTPVKDGYKSGKGVVASADVLAAAKRRGATFTAYIAGAWAYTLASHAEGKRPVVVMVPVNLRRIFPSATLKNFVTFVRVVIPVSPRPTLEQCVAEAAAQLADRVSPQHLKKYISNTVKGSSGILNAVSVGTKKFFMRLGRLFMRSRQTTIFSNLGAVDMPAELGVVDAWMQMNVSKNNVVNLSAVTHDGRSCFTFTRAIEEDDLQRAFFDVLRSDGLAVAENDAFCD